VLGIIHSIWRPKTNRFKDYIAVPKPNGYRSLHTTVFGPDNKAIEFQIRTKEMDDEAKFGISAHWYYKNKAGNPEDVKKQPVWVQDILNIQKEAENTHDFLKQIKFDVFQDRIFVFSPHGDVFDLPKKSTPIDFAFAVHTDIGAHAVGALINDKMSTLDQELHNGDMVEIIIDKKRRAPNQDWLKFVKTSRAKSKIKQSEKHNMMENIKKFIPKI
jgi:GTP pyrophosphokinase